MRATANDWLILNLGDKAMISLRELVDFYVLRRNRLEAIPLLPLGAPLSEAIVLYGPPLTSEAAKETQEISFHTFSVDRYHQAIVSEWKSTIQSITYWSVKSDPARDLDLLLEFYRQGSSWDVMEKGYWYQRKDCVLRVWCSAAPAIGVGYVSFLSAQANFKTAWEIRQLDSLEDPTWASNDTIHDLQRRFAMKEDTALLDFVRRSEHIASSPDGRDVIIVRDHHAYDVVDGFMELNCPPDLAKGYATQVINFFRWSETASIWGKATLPRDAIVDYVQHDDDGWHLSMRHATTGKSLTFRGTAQEIRLLCEISTPPPYKDEQLWADLENRVKNSPPK